VTFREFVRRSITFVLIATAAVVTVLLITRVYPILMLMLLSWIISVGLSIPINYLRRRGLRRGVAIAVTFALAVVIAILFFRFVGVALGAQVKDLLVRLPDAGEAAVRSYGEFRASSVFLSGILPEFTVEEYRNLLNTTVGTSTIDFASAAGSALPFVINVGGFLANLVLNLFLICFLTFYFVLDPMVYYQFVLAVVPTAREKRVLDVLEKIRQTIMTWVGSMVLEVIVTALMVAVALGIILRLPNAIALGILAGLGNVVPYVGYWAALIPIVVFAAAEGGPTMAILAFVFYFVIGIVEANIILPANLGIRLKLPAALVLLFQGIAATLLGFWGVLLATPILAILWTLVHELIVSDALGKRDHVPRILERPDGELVLVEEPALPVPGE
jgi:predicted PurR-regulated permease PerM